ncbi:hypothetical protein VPH35_025888 [Triticum aestivum]
MGNCFGSEETELERVNTPGHHGQLQPQATESRSLPPMSAPHARQSRGLSMSVITSRSSSGTSNISAAFLEPEEGMILEVPNLRVFTFIELKAATRNFKPNNLLGEGGFGRVYKGWVDQKTMNPMSSGIGSAMVIAVKKLNPGSRQGLEEWQCEVNFLGRMSHPNLVRLLGYCLEERELLLVYEFMANGSLENHLFRREGGSVHPISWALRLRIAIGAARGLAFLHSSDKHVIYQDFKSSNILLDTHYNAKISDFGLVRNGPAEGDNHVNDEAMYLG